MPILRGPSMMSLEVRDDLAVQVLDDLHKQVSFAVANALNDVAFGARKDIFVQEIKKNFELKNRFLIKGLRPGAKGPGGVGVRKANKKDPTAVIFYGEGAEFLTLHEFGGTKKPPTGLRRFGIVEPGFGKGKTKRKKPIIDAADAGSGRGRARRIFRVDKGTPRERIVERLAGKEVGRRVLTRGKRKGQAKKRKRRALRTLLWMEPKARVPEVLDIEERSGRYMERRFRSRFRVQFERAVRTAKRKAR